MPDDLKIHETVLALRAAQDEIKALRDECRFLRTQCRIVESRLLAVEIAQKRVAERFPSTASPEAPS